MTVSSNFFQSIPVLPDLTFYTNTMTFSVPTSTTLDAYSPAALLDTVKKTILTQETLSPQDNTVSLHSVNQWANVLDQLNDPGHNFFDAVASKHANVYLLTHSYNPSPYFWASFFNYALKILVDKYDKPVVVLPVLKYKNKFSLSGSFNANLQATSCMQPCLGKTYLVGFVVSSTSDLDKHLLNYTKLGAVSLSEVVDSVTLLFSVLKQKGVLHKEDIHSALSNWALHTRTQSFNNPPSLIKHRYFGEPLLSSTKLHYMLRNMVTNPMNEFVSLLLNPEAHLSVTNYQSLRSVMTDPGFLGSSSQLCPLLVRRAEV